MATRQKGDVNSTSGPGALWVPSKCLLDTLDKCLFYKTIRV